MNSTLLSSLNTGAVFRESDFPCVGLSFSGDGNSLGASFEDGTVHVINTESAEISRTHRSHKYGLSHFSFLNNDRRGSLAVAVASPSIVQDFSIRVWDLVQNRFARVFKYHECEINNVSVHSSRDLVLSSSCDGASCIWDLRDERPIWQYRDQKGSTSAFDRSEGSDIFAVTSPATNAISLFDFRKFQAPQREVKCVANPTRELAFTADRERLLAASWESGIISTINLEKGGLESTYFIPPTKRRYNLSTSFCSKFAMASNPSSHGIDIWDIRTRAKVRSLMGHESASIGAFSPKHAMVATASLPVALWVPLKRA
jgi:WD40 repeat protein